MFPFSFRLLPSSWLGEFRLPFPPLTFPSSLVNRHGASTNSVTGTCLMNPTLLYARQESLYPRIPEAAFQDYTTKSTLNRTPLTITSPPALGPVPVGPAVPQRVRFLLARQKELAGSLAPQLYFKVFLLLSSPPDPRRWPPKRRRSGVTLRPLRRCPTSAALSCSGAVLVHAAQGGCAQKR